MREPPLTSRRRGTTLPELLVVLLIVALMTSFVLPSLKRGFDRIEVRGAGRELLMLFFSTRAAAITSGRRTAVAIDGARGRASMISYGETLLVRPVGALHGVRLAATRDSMTYYPNGLALGGANLSIVVSRGSVAETVLVSREGRVKLGARAR